MPLAASRLRARSPLFSPQSSEPFRLSRTKLELFLNCPRCFYLDRRLGIARPDGPPFTLNAAVDLLLKREFDVYRARGTAHPLMVRCGIDAIPYMHRQLVDWRDMRIGIQFRHPSGFLLYGAIDDVWIDHSGALSIVDYKATSTQREVTLGDPWKDAYKRQMEIYQWLFLKNGFTVSPVGYFVYVNADRERSSFENRLDFAAQILPYTGSTAWIDDAVTEAHACLMADHVPTPASACAWCSYRSAATLHE